MRAWMGVVCALVNTCGATHKAETNFWASNCLQDLAPAHPEVLAGDFLQIEVKDAGSLKEMGCGSKGSGGRCVYPTWA